MSKDVPRINPPGALTDMSKMSKEYRHKSGSRGLSALFSLFALTLVALLAACDNSGAALSNVRASTDSIVPGSTGIGKPPGVVQISYTLGRQAEVAVDID